MTGHIDRDELRKLADAATPGPWEVEPGSPWDEDGIEVKQDGVSAPDGSITWDDHGGEVFLPQNAAFIAAARTAVPALLDVLDQAEARIKAVRELHVSDEHGCCYGCYSTWPGYTEEHPAWPCATIRALDGER